MKSHRTDGERILAVFIDFENVGLGFGGRRDRFSIEKVLERLVEKGKIVAKKAYADWSRFGGYAASLHSAAIELIEIPKRAATGKNSADIRLVVDAIDLAYSKEHIDTFVIVSGDSDFSPLVSKLKELGKHVIGLGLADSTSDLLRDNCDEFIYYEDLDRVPSAPLAENTAVPEAKRKVFALLLDSLLALRRENKETIFSSMVKDTMKRKKPSFNEEYHGYRTFSDLLEDAQKHGIVDLERHKSSGTYVVTRFGSEPRATAPVVPRVATSTTPPTRPVSTTPSRPGPATSKPPAKPAPARGREPASTGRRGASAPAVPIRTAAKDGDQSEELEAPLGRALIEEVDELDDVPSYRPRKPDDEPRPAGKGAKPRPRAGAESPPARRKATSSGEAPSARSGPRTSEAKPSRKPAASPPPAKPVPPDDDFGAGLDL